MTRVIGVRFRPAGRFIILHQVNFTSDRVTK